MSREVECIDCGVDIQFDPTRKEQRCDECEKHHLGICEPDCPIVGCERATQTEMIHHEVVVLRSDP